jgi:glycosyltransferase involved in cell wall biosynthesis
MKVLVVLTYYRPHVSGLTIYVERLSKALAARGHQVTVLTSQYDRHLPLREQIDGVIVRRMPVAFRLSKGVVMPTIGWEATRQVWLHDVVSLHLPQFDAAGVAIRGRVLGKPTVLTYHCDVRLPSGGINPLANIAVNTANRLAASLCDRVVAYTQDYADHSPFLRRYAGKVQVIPPPVEVTSVSRQETAGFIRRYGLTGKPVIGMAARLATEKGVEYLLRALPAILAEFPDAKVWFAGQYENVLGEAEYAQRLEPLLEEYADHWTFLGSLDPAQMASFFKSCDVSVLPSVNSTESFGLVQIESMILGTPVVASALPGVRQPVLTTGMGKVVPPRDSKALSEAIIDVLRHPQSFKGRPAEVAPRFAPDAVAAQYEAMFTNLLRREVAVGSA